jgi:hypothetical protein
MDLNALFELAAQSAEHLSPRDLTGFAIAVGFLIVFRTMAWAWKKPVSSNLTTTVLGVLGNANPANIRRNGKNFTLGNLVFDKDRILSVSGNTVDGKYLPRRERRQVRSQISKLMTRYSDYENAKLAESVLGRQEQNVAAFVPSPSPYVAREVSSNRAAQAVASCFNGKFKQRSLKGILENTGLTVAEAQQVLSNGNYTTTSSGLYRRV